MIFKISSFLTPALALSSLDAVSASLVPRKIDGGGQLNGRDSCTSGSIKYFNQKPEENNYKGTCGVNYTDGSWVTLSQFDESECDKRNLTVSTDVAKFNLIIAGKCEDCDGIEVSPDIWTYLNANHSATSETAIISNGTWCPS